MSNRSSANASILEKAANRLPASRAPSATRAFELAQRAHRMLEAMEGLAQNRNPSDTEEGHALRVSKAAQTLKGNLAQIRNSLTENLNNSTYGLRAKINEATGLSLALPSAQEIRAAVRGMKHGEKLSLIDQAMKAKDTEILSAVLGVHPFLTGIDPKMQRDLRDSYEAQVAPDLVAEFEALLEIDDAASVVLRNVDAAAAEAARPEYIAKITAAAARAEKAQAQFTEAAAPPIAAE